jgi:hypothetical protein
MEPSGRNRWQPVANGTPQKPLKQADPQPVATHGNGFGAHGKEGVDGSSSSEGSARARTSGPCVPVDFRVWRVPGVWTLLWSFQALNVPEFAFLTGLGESKASASAAGPAERRSHLCEREQAVRRRQARLHGPQNCR